MVTVRRIDAAHKQDIRLPNQPFSLWGQLVPTYDGQTWHYTARYFAPQAVREMCFPDEYYSYEAMERDTVFLGAYDGGRCIGLALLREAPYRYMYLYDLKVDAEYRRQGVGAALLASARGIASSKGYHGLYTQGQDDNLSACLFYLRQGFCIGGLDTAVYKGTSQEGKADILFYWDFASYR